MQSYTAIDIFLLIVAVVVLPAMSAISGRSLARTPRSELNLVSRYWFITIRSLFIALLVLFQWRWATRPFSTLGLDVPISYWGRWGFVFDFVIGCSFAVELLVRDISGDRLSAMRKRLDSYRIIPRTRAEFVLFGPMALVGSVTEEILYRGFLFWFLTPLAGLSGAVLISSIAFGLGHIYQGWMGVVRTSCIGLAFGVAYALTGSLWWLMVVHTMFNSFGGLVAWRLQRKVRSDREVDG
jgi:membrane protease YdiL (CAAX protease family)